MSQQGSLNVVAYSGSLQRLAADFTSGNDYLDSFLREPISLDSGYGKTYVWLSNDNEAILGYYNIGTGSVDEEQAGVKVKLGGAVHINCFALDKDFQGQTKGYTDAGNKINLSDLLLFDCLQRIESARSSFVGFAFVTLCSTAEGYGLYKRNGFYDLDEDMRFSVEEEPTYGTKMYYALDLE